MVTYARRSFSVPIFEAPLRTWMVGDKGIEPRIPVWHKTQRKDVPPSSTEFEWDEGCSRGVAGATFL